MKPLNTESIMNCEFEDQTNRHFEECAKIMESFHDFYIVKRTYSDIGNAWQQPKYYTAYVDDIPDILEWFDSKNGMDILENEDGHIVIRLFGQGYTLTSDNTSHIVKTDLEFIPEDINETYYDMDGELMTETQMKDHFNAIKNDPECDIVDCYTTYEEWLTEALMCYVTEL